MSAKITRKLPATGQLNKTQPAGTPATGQLNKTASSGTPTTIVDSGDSLGLKAFLNDILAKPPTGVTAKWFASTAEGAATRLNFLNQRLHDPKFWNQLSPAMQAALEGANGQRYLAAIASDPNFLSAVRTTWNVSGTSVPKMDATKLANFKKNISLIDAYKAGALKDYLSRTDLSQDDIKLRAQADMSMMTRPLIVDSGIGV